MLARAGKGHKHLHEPAPNLACRVLLQAHHSHKPSEHAPLPAMPTRHTTQTAAGGAAAEQLVAATSKINSKLVPPVVGCVSASRTPRRNGRAGLCATAASSRRAHSATAWTSAAVGSATGTKAAVVGRLVVMKPVVGAAVGSPEGWHLRPTTSAPSAVIPTGHVRTQAPLRRKRLLVHTRQGPVEKPV
jgi:hypothetical protein